MYMGSFVRANIEQIKKIKSLIQSIKNFSANIFKSMISLKKQTQVYTPDEIQFAKEQYSAQHDEIVAVNVYVFLVGTGCVKVEPNTGSLHLNHDVVQINTFIQI